MRKRGSNKVYFKYFNNVQTVWSLELKHSKKNFFFYFNNFKIFLKTYHSWNDNDNKGSIKVIAQKFITYLKMFD